MWGKGSPAHVLLTTYWGDPPPPAESQLVFLHDYSLFCQQKNAIQSYHVVFAIKKNAETTRLRVPDLQKFLYLPHDFDT